MSKIIICHLFILLACSLYAQKELVQYKAINGIIYKIGDTIRFANPSGSDQNFQYIFKTGLATLNIENLSSIYIDTSYKGLPFIIKKIESFRQKGREKILFLVQGKGVAKYDVHIDSAIRNREITSYYDTLFYIKPKKSIHPVRTQQELLQRRNRMIF